MSFPAVRICNEDETSFIEVVPERGGIITRWHALNREVLYLDEARFADPTLSVRGGIPVLFPICGNLPDNRYTDNGESFALKQHGFARDLPWTIAHQTPTSLAIALRSNAQTLTQYPFEFEFTLTYTLKGTCLALQSAVANRSSRMMPFSLGFHPYFAVQDKSAIALNLPAEALLDHLTLQRQPYTGTLDLQAPELDVALFPVTAQTAAMTEQLGPSNFTLEITSDPVFTTLVVWAVQGKPYLCLEPWSAQRNALNTGADLIRLAPNASMEAQVAISLTEHSI
jgi:galactose mutarotase-like enzyme